MMTTAAEIDEEGKKVQTHNSLLFAKKSEIHWN